VSVQDKRVENLESISLELTRVDYSNPTIFMCGGKVDVTLPAPVSARGMLVEYMHKVDCHYADSITLAEDFKDWIHDSIYKDLLVFESDIAQIASIIVIFLESAGSLAELGVFVRNRLFSDKLLVFVNQQYYDQDSFIKLGPLRHLEANKDTSVCAYPWDETSLENTLTTSLPEIHEDLINSLGVQSKTEAFNKDNDGHISFIVFEIIKIYRALMLSEIEHYLSVLDLTTRRDKLKRLLFLLKKFHMIDVRKRGHVEYYFVIVNYEKLKFGGKFDRTKAKIQAMQYYINDKKESRRVKLIQSLVKEYDQESSTLKSERGSE